MNPLSHSQSSSTTRKAAPVLAICASLILLVYLWSSSAVAQPRDEYAVKAAFVFNFALLTEWPSAAFSDQESDILLCVVGGDDLPKAFKSIDGKMIGDRTLQVTSVDTGTKLPNCQIIFYREETNTEELIRTLYAVKDKSVLTIGEKNSVTKLGGAIHFFTEKGKLRFAINPAVISSQGLKISSRLLKIATLIDD